MAGMALKKDKEEELQKYFQPRHPGSFSGVDKFKKSLKKRKNTAKEIRNFLKSKEAYTLHYPVRYRFPRSRVVVAAVNQLYDIDLLFMVDLSNDNDGWKYILTCVDILSHYAFCEKLRSKTSSAVAKAFEKILDRAKEQSRTPMQVRSDSGSEFIGKPFKNLMTERGIKHFLTLNVDVKANFSER